MIYSMTGFGKGLGTVTEKQVSVEMRALNSKQLDLNLKMPNRFRVKENEIRQLISEQLKRGKIDLWIGCENGSSNGFSINQTLLTNYYKEIKNLQKQLHAESDNAFSMALNMPEVIQQKELQLADKEWKVLKQIISDAIKEVNNFRKQEGKSIEKCLQTALKLIDDNLKKIEKLDNARIKKMRKRIENNAQTFLGKDKVNMDRFEQEMLYYLEKMDITEEKNRLKNHIDYFSKTINNNGGQGKKLGFISQEMGREINTLSAKAYDADIQYIVVNMKDELEKIKEQLLNIL